MKTKKSLELAALLDRFAVLVDEVGEADFAALHRRHARALRSEPDDADVKSIGADIVATLRVGSGNLADRYMVHEDGTPDVERSREYVVMVDDVRRRAKRIS